MFRQMNHYRQKCVAQTVDPLFFVTFAVTLHEDLLLKLNIRRCLNYRLVNRVLLLVPGLFKNKSSTNKEQKQHGRYL